MLKLRRTLALWMTFIAPLVIVGLAFVVMLSPAVPARGRTSDGAWQMLVRNAAALWTVLMLPLFVTLECALTAGLEHGNRQWKHIYALPIPRWSVYVAKMVTNLWLLALAAALWVGLTAAAGAILVYARPALHMELKIPWRHLLFLGSATTCAALLVWAIQSWISLRWRSFTVSVSFGISVTVISFVVAQSKYAPVYPWSMPLMVTVANQEHIIAILLGNFVGAAVVATVGCWECVRRDVL
jgi:ABC-2 type transport system permease protein